MSHKEYRVVHKTPGAMAPLHCNDLEEAKSVMDVAGGLAQHLKIQSRTVTEWEDA